MSVAVIDAALEPLALSPANAARFLSISKRSLSRLIAAKKIEARKDGPRTLVDVASLKAYYALAEKNRSCADCIRPPRSCAAAVGCPGASLTAFSGIRSDGV
jgi:excisionase family DNA binding protein